VTASTNPWSQVYKLEAGKMLSKNIITTLTKQDGSEMRNTKETMEVLLDYLFEEDNTEGNQYQKQIRKTVEQPIKTIDDRIFKRGYKASNRNFNDKKAPGIDRITAGIYLRTFKTFPNLITTIYNQCLKSGCFPQRWKVAKIIPTIKPGKENSTDPSKYRPISLLNLGGKVLEQLLTNRINYHLYKKKLMTNKQYGSIAQKNYYRRNYGGKKIHRTGTGETRGCHNDQPKC